MYFIPITSSDDLQEGRFHVMEPKGTIDDVVIPEEGDLFLVPGALFDRRKHRIGYSGGYYDTYFEKYQGYRKIGIAFSEQLAETDILTEKTDIFHGAQRLLRTCFLCVLLPLCRARKGFEKALFFVLHSVCDGAILAADVGKNRQKGGKFHAETFRRVCAQVQLQACSKRRARQRSRVS